MIRVTIEVDGYPRNVRVEQVDEYHSTTTQTVDKIREAARKASEAAVQAVLAR